MKNLQKSFPLLEIEKDVKLYSKDIITKANKMNPQNLKLFLKVLIDFKIKDKNYFEILSMEFIKKIDEFPLKDKILVFYYLALEDIDPSYLYKSLERMVNSYVEAVSFHGSQDLPLGLFTK